MRSTSDSTAGGETGAGPCAVSAPATITSGSANTVAAIPAPSGGGDASRHASISLRHR